MHDATKGTYVMFPNLPLEEKDNIPGPILVLHVLPHQDSSKMSQGSLPLAMPGFAGRGMGEIYN